MTAEEMFKELGYNKTGDCEFIAYEKYFNEVMTQEIFFIKATGGIWFHNNMYQNGKQIKLTLAEFKSIQKQMEELGW